MKVTERGRSASASPPAAWSSSSRASAGLGTVGWRGTTTACGTCPPTGSGSGITAVSSTPGWVARTASSSSGEIRWSNDLNMSSRRPSNRTQPLWSHSARSPVAWRQAPSGRYPGCDGCSDAPSEVAEHGADRPLGQVDADLPGPDPETRPDLVLDRAGRTLRSGGLTGRRGLGGPADRLGRAGLTQHQPVSGQHPAQPAPRGPLPGWCPDQGGRLGLPVAVPRPDSPLLLDPVGDRRVEDLPGAGRLAQRRVCGVEERQHRLPGAGRGAEAGDPVPFEQRRQQLRERRARRGRHDRRLGVPRHEQAAPGMLGPAGRGHVEVPVAGQQAVPVHAGQVADRVALVGVRDQLRRRGRTGGEVAERHRVGRRRAGRLERPVRVLRAGEGVPARPGSNRLTPTRRLPRPAVPRPGTPSTRGLVCSASSSRHTTCRAPLRLTRSDSSRAVSPTWQGITTAPSLRQASRVSHSSGRASSTTRTRCPR